MRRYVLKTAPLLLVATLAASFARAQAGDAPPDLNKHGIRGRVVVEDLSRGWPVPEQRQKAFHDGALVRRTLGRPLRPFVEPAPPLTIILEGEDIQRDLDKRPVFKVEGYRFSPSGLVLPRPGVITIENHQGETIVVADPTGVINEKIVPGGKADVVIGEGEHLLSVKSMPSTTMSVTALPAARMLPVVNGEIPLVEIPSGNYSLSFYMGTEKLRQQPIRLAENGLVFIDATVSANGTVDVSLKDASLRLATQPDAPDAP